MLYKGLCMCEVYQTELFFVLFFSSARQRHLGLHLREDPGDGAAVTDAQTDQPDQE